MHRRSSSAIPSRAVKRTFRPGSKSLSQSIRNGHRRDVRKFKTSGPVVAAKHYCIPPLERIDLEYVLGLIHEAEYFILHTPRQTGKTSALKALQGHLNSGAASDYRCVYVNIEGAQTARQDMGRAMRTILGRLATRAQLVLKDNFIGDIRPEILRVFEPDEALEEALVRCAASDPRPLVLLIDAIDALLGDSLLSVLH